MNHGHTTQEAIPIGVEVSTRSGRWRTLQYPVSKRVVPFYSRNNPLEKREVGLIL